MQRRRRIIHGPPHKSWRRDKDAWVPNIKEIIAMTPSTDPALLSVMLGFSQQTLNGIIIQSEKHSLEDRFLETLEKSLQCNATPHCRSNTIQVITENKLADRIMEMLEKPFIDQPYPALSKVIREQLDISKNLSKQNTKPIKQEPSDKRDDCFRSKKIISIFEDIYEDSGHSLKPNKIHGQYSGVDEYLDVQFGLLYEDFNASLREGILNLRKGFTDDENEHVYERARILEPVCGYDCVNFVLNFEVKKNKKNVDRKERLKEGSLVCLSKDQFQTFYVAEVTKKRWSGCLEIKFMQEDIEIQKEIGSSFTMLESSVYFRAYQPVLQSLQTIQEKDLPFRRYIIQSKNNVYPPKYLTKGRGRFFNLDCLIDDDINSSLINKALQEVDILKKDKKWPFEKKLDLDLSQLKALKAALGNEISLIQGPPGCGKTFIGSLIAKVLLRNRKNWRRIETKCSQMLVVCYTNHGLDQLFAGLCSFCEDNKINIVRVGERSKNEKLQKYNLNSKKIYVRKEKKMPKELRQIYDSSRDSVNSIKNKLDNEFLKIQTLQENFVREKALWEVMDPDHRRQIEELQSNCDEYPVEQFSYLDGSAIIQWLGIYDEAETIYKSCNIPDISSTKVKSERNYEYYDEAYLEFRRISLAIDLNEPCEIKEDNANSEEKIKAVTKHSLFRLLKRKLATIKPMSETDAKYAYDIVAKQFLVEKRWSLYLYWVQRMCRSIYNRNIDKVKSYKNASLIMNDIRKVEDIMILKKADIIGMTITKAAMIKDILDEIKPVITIVEEAAQIFESNTISNLTSGCEHLIMIGDHKQLRPQPNTHRLGKEYNMNVSLFERMIINGIQCQCLETQHRMRPEIADHVRCFYKCLEDHDSVKHKKSVRGMACDIYFVDHQIDERKGSESGDFVNDYEVRCILELCKHLLLHGYDSKRITILTTYNSQLDLFKEKAIETDCHDIFKTTVDGFQGEENDIIFLSLVRSNKNGKIGFLEESNRVCVALSRAKIGFYIVGNSKCLSSKSILWRGILYGMKERNQLGRESNLRCHSDNKDIIATLPKNFAAVFRGDKRRRFENECFEASNRQCFTSIKTSERSFCENEDMSPKSFDMLPLSNGMILEKVGKKRKVNFEPGNEPKKKVQKVDGNRGIGFAHTKERYLEESFRNSYKSDDEMCLEGNDIRNIKIKNQTIPVKADPSNERTTQTFPKISILNEISSTTRSIVDYGDSDMFENSHNEDAEYSVETTKGKKHLLTGDLRGKLNLKKRKWDTMYPGNKNCNSQTSENNAYRGKIDEKANGTLECKGDSTSGRLIGKNDLRHYIKGGNKMSMEIKR